MTAKCKGRATVMPIQPVSVNTTPCTSFLLVQGRYLPKSLTSKSAYQFPMPWNESRFRKIKEEDPYHDHQLFT